jgi:hypothetical protein
MSSLIPNSEIDISDESSIGQDEIVETYMPRNISVIRDDLNAEWKLGAMAISISHYKETSKINSDISVNKMWFFQLLMTDYIIKFMVRESNNYADAHMNATEKANCKLITLSEMKKFLSLIIFV